MQQRRLSDPKLEQGLECCAHRLAGVRSKGAARGALLGVLMGVPGKGDENVRVNEAPPAGN